MLAEQLRAIAAGEPGDIGAQIKVLAAGLLEANRLVSELAELIAARQLPIAPAPAASRLANPSA